MDLLQRSRPTNSCIRHQPATNRRRWSFLPCITWSGRELRTCVRVSAGPKEIWLQTSDKATLTAALESGRVSAFVFGPDPEHQTLAATWSALGRFRSLNLDSRGLLSESETGRLVGEVVAVDGPQAARELEARVQWRGQGRGKVGPGAAATEAEAAEGGTASLVGPHRGAEWTLVLDARDWKVIPAENLVALAQPDPTSSNPGASSLTGAQLPVPTPRLMATAGSAADAQLMMEALQSGTRGVLLRSNDPVQVRTLVSYISRRAAEESDHPDALQRYSVARVLSVRQLGMGDRACVDLAGLMQPGEGLLVGSFARCLALVHSECGESQYIASRPFRVNAGPVHAYVSCPGGRTRYLSELSSGMEVLVADPVGRSRTALVGRVKIERRPLVLVELATSEGTGTEMAVGMGEENGSWSKHSLMLQNAETVKMVGPAGVEASGDGRGGGGGSDGDGSEVTWRAVSVSALQPEDLVYVLLQPPARHTGIAVEEFILEK